MLGEDGEEGGGVSLWAVTAVQAILCRRGRHHFIEVEPGYAYCVCGKTIAPKLPSPPRPFHEYLDDEDFEIMAMDDE